MIENAKSSYSIPWDVGFKERRISTPAPPTFDASSKTKTGFSLNDNYSATGGAVQLHYFLHDNASSEILSWLQDCKVRFTVNIIVTDANLLRENLSPKLRAAWLNANKGSQNTDVSANSCD